MKLLIYQHKHHERPEEKGTKERIADAAEYAAAKTRRAIDSVKETSKEVAASAERGWKDAEKPKTGDAHLLD